MKGLKTTDKPNKYNFVDSNVKSPKVFYRLKIIKENGDINYSKIIRVYTGYQGLKLYPNPVNDFFNLEILSGNIILSKNLIKIYSLYGYLIQNYGLQITNNKLRFDVSNLSSGIYVLQLGDFSNIFFIIN